MNDWKSRLREADPGHDAALSAADVQRMRSVVLAAAGEASSSRSMMWPRAFVVAATVLVMVCASMLAALQGLARQVDDAKAAEMRALPKVVPLEEENASEGERQQLHFMTPGGTRIIWVFDSQFEVKGTLP